MNNEKKDAQGINQAENNLEHAEKKDFEKKGTRKNQRNGQRSNRRNGSSSSKNSNRRGCPTWAKTSVPGTNDSIWYALNEQLLKDSASLSFNNPLGAGITQMSQLGSRPVYTPGVAVINYIPGIGKSTDNFSAVNLSARRLYTFVRHANSGSANYDSPDLFMYVLAVNSVYITFCHLVRAYGIANLYSMYNRYMPDTLLQSMGFDPDDVRLNLASLRYGINVAAAKMNQLAVPAEMTYFKRSAWLASKVFKDAATVKSQLYVMNPVTYFTFEEMTSTQGSSLTCSPYYTSSSSGNTVDEWLNILNQQLGRLIQSEDIGIMAGDILKAYGSSSLMIVPQIPESYIVTPEYDEEFLMQFQNATCLAPGTANRYPTGSLTSFNVTQQANTGAIIYNPSFSYSGYTAGATSPASSTYYTAQAYNNNKGFTLRIDDPTPADAMVASRLTAWGSTLSGTDPTANGTFTLNTFGTELVWNYLIWGRSATGQVMTLASSLPTYIFNVSSLLSSSATLFDRMSYFSKFDWLPAFSTVDINGTTLLPIQDWDNITSISTSVIDKMHQTALMSMFDVRGMGYLTK